ncbi:MAG: D-alanine--D-alanine ligase family protein [Nannocystales bacterium]
MRPLTFGVLVSAPSARLAPTTADLSGGQPVDETIEGLMDLRSGTDLATALRELGYAACPIAVDDDLDLALRQSDVDACLLALHGRAGGRGDVQSLLAMRGLPYAGPPSAAVSLAFDKIRSRQVLAYHNLPTPASLALGPNHKASDKALELLGWPCVVKPRRGGLGLGVAHLMDPEHVSDAVGRALDIDDEVVLERALSGTEVQVVVMGDRVLGAMEVHRRPIPGVLGGKEDFDANYVCPPQMSRGQIDGLHNLARRAVSALGLSEGITRVDLMVGDRYNEAILEVEPLPPLHRDGVVSRVARAAGISYPELVSHLVERVLPRLARCQTSAPAFLQ